MTSPGPSRAEAWRLGRNAFVRILLSLGALLAAYYLLPARDTGSDVPWLLLALTAFCAVVALQVWFIVRATHPLVRAIEALVLAISIFLLIFARSYLSGALHDPSAFNQPMDRTGALYFTVSCFATVGFGDIVATSEPMRLLVTVQMILDLVLLGAVVKIFTSAVRQARARREPPAQ